MVGSTPVPSSRCPVDLDIIDREKQQIAVATKKAVAASTRAAGPSTDQLANLVSLETKCEHFLAAT